MGTSGTFNFKLIVFSFFLAGCTEHVKVRSNEQPYWLVYNTSNSPLPDNQVHALAIDDSDVKWIGTSNGLARFDGTSWVTYDTTNSALSSNFITCIATTDQGIIWIGTNKGLVHYNGSTWTVQNNLKDDFITKLFYDGKTGILWVGTDRGLCSYDGIRWDLYDDP
jgi:ligand-binding sensor domain-containing protein